MSKQTIYNVGIYVRLSQEDMRTGESLSIENQKLILTKYVTEQGWNIENIYVDDGYDEQYTYHMMPVRRKGMNDKESIENCYCQMYRGMVDKDLAHSRKCWTIPLFWCI